MKGSQVATRKQKIEYGLTILVLLAAGAGWLYIAINQRQQNDPVGIVKKHFLFYPQYAHGAWHESPCAPSPTQAGDAANCRAVSYTVPVPGCGNVTFDWSVYPGDDANRSWSYNGTRPKLDEADYPLYAMLSDDSHFMDSPALGKPLPQTCQLK